MKLLLEDTQLEAIIKDNTIIIKKKQSPLSSGNNLGNVEVLGTKRDGTANEGYLMKDISGIGAWGSRSLQDTPFSINTFSADLIENTIAGDMDQIIKMNPLTQSSYASQDADFPAYISRGFFLNQNYVFDGVRLSSNAYGLSLEEFERVEQLSGLSGFLYGGGSVGGITNYVLKRPTSERLTNLTLGNYGGEQYFAHLDLGGPIDKEGKFAYRVNLVHQDGETSKDNQNLEKTLVSTALDWKVNDEILVQVNAAYKNHELKGRESAWVFQKTPPASQMDSKSIYAPNWTGSTITTKRIGSNINWDINDNLSLRGAYIFKKSRRKGDVSRAMETSRDTFSFMAGKLAPFETHSHGASLYLDTGFNLLDTKHKVTFGVYGDKTKTKLHPDNFAISFLGVNLSKNDFTNFSRPNISAGQQSMYTSARTKNTNIIIGDDITFNEQWSALIGFNYTTIEAKNYNTDGSFKSAYDKSELTPSLSLIYKPFENLSTYVTYIESLEQGTIVDSTYKNAGDVLDPLLSKQYEIGAKYSISENLALNTAIFRIEKANQYSDDGTNIGTFVQDGLQVHDGIELMLTGKLSDNLTVMAGGTVLDAKIKENNNASLEDKKPTGTSQKMFSLFSEYNIPELKGLSINGGVYYTGEVNVDAANTITLPSRTTADFGARYETKIDKYPTTFRMNVANITDKKYWGSTFYNLGNPRTISFSMKMEF